MSLVPPGHRQVRIVLYAQIPADAPDPDSLAALKRLIEDDPLHVEVYDVQESD